MMSSTLGAPFGGTTRGGHHGVDSEAFSLITPPNFGSGRRKLFAIERGGGTGFTERASNLNLCPD